MEHRPERGDVERMRALIVGPVPPPIGGDTVSTLNLLRSGYWDEAGIELMHLNTSRGHGLRLPHDRLSFGDVLFGLSVWARFLVRMPRADIVLLWGNSRFVCTVGVAMILSSMLLGRPVVVKIFGAFLVRRLREFNRLWRWPAAALIRRVKYILAQTRGFARELVRELGVPDSRVVFFPNFLPGGAAGEGPEGRAFTGRCVFIGQIKRDKGVFEIVEALAGRDEITCDFYGQILEDDRGSFREGTEGRDNLIYRGILDPEDVAPVLRGYDVLLLPTYHPGEGYPAVILEAFAAGVPVVTTDWLSIPEIVEDGVRGILVPPRAPGKLLEALRRLASDGALYDSIARNAFEYVEAFTEEAVVRDILINRVLGRGRS